MNIQNNPQRKKKNKKKKKGNRKKLKLKLRRNARQNHPLAIWRADRGICEKLRLKYDKTVVHFIKCFKSIRWQTMRKRKRIASRFNRFLHFCLTDSPPPYKKYVGYRIFAETNMLGDSTGIFLWSVLKCSLEGNSYF